MQVFRLMNMPDRVIAFDSLPQELCEGFDLCRADGFPRHWKEWMGKIVKKTNVPPEKDLLTGQVRRYDPIIEENHFFYLVDYTVRPVMERWQNICEYVKRNVDKDVRLLDKLDDMAVPLAPDKVSGVTLEPEDVPLIKLPKLEVKKDEIVKQDEKVVSLAKVEKRSFKCDQCSSEFDKQRGLWTHVRFKHKNAVAA